MTHKKVLSVMLVIETILVLLFVGFSITYNTYEYKTLGNIAYTFGVISSLFVISILTYIALMYNGGNFSK